MRVSIWTGQESYIYKYTSLCVSKSPRAAYVNYGDLDLLINNRRLVNTSFNQASAWIAEYFKDNFHRLERIKTKVDPDYFFGQ